MQASRSMRNKKKKCDVRITEKIVKRENFISQAHMHLNLYSGLLETPLEGIFYVNPNNTY